MQERTSTPGRPTSETIGSDDQNLSEVDQRIVYPAHHTPWCDVRTHNQTIEENGSPFPCIRYVASDFVPHINRCPDSVDIDCTRSEQPVWAVEIQQVSHTRASGQGWVEDTVIVLTSGQAGNEVWRLLPGEARHLAAALIAGADRVMFA